MKNSQQLNTAPKAPLKYNHSPKIRRFREHPSQQIRKLLRSFTQLIKQQLINENK